MKTFSRITIYYHNLESEKRNKFKTTDSYYNARESDASSIIGFALKERGLDNRNPTNYVKKVEYYI